MIQSNRRHVVRSDRPAPPVATVTPDAEPTTKETGNLTQTQINDRIFMAQQRAKRKNFIPEFTEQVIMVATTERSGGTVSASPAQGGTSNDLTQQDEEFLAALFAPASRKKSRAKKTGEENTSGNTVEAQDTAKEDTSLTVKANQAAKPGLPDDIARRIVQKAVLALASEDSTDTDTNEIPFEQDEVREVLGSSSPRHLVRVDELEHGM